MKVFALEGHTIPDDHFRDMMAFPRWLRREAFAARARAEGLEILEGEVKLGDEDLLRKVPVWILRTEDGDERTFPMALAERLLGAQIGCLQKITGLHNVRTVPVFLLKDERARYSAVVSGSPDRVANQQVAYEKPMSAYERILRRLHGLYGYVFRLHLRYDANTINPPLPDARGTIDLFINMRPPGGGMDVKRQEVFGLAIGTSTEGGWTCTGPSRGVGTVMKDPAGEPVVQVLGRNVFLLVPLCSPFNAYTSERIFWRLMQATIEGLERESTRSRLSSDLDAFAEEVRDWIVEWPKAILGIAERAEAEASRARQTATLKQAEAKEWRAMANFLERSDAVQRVLDRVPQEFRRIQAMELVARFWTAEKGVHVATRDIVIERDGKRFLIGPLMIRMSNVAKVHVWSEDPKGPEGAPHPHVDHLEDPCFGNAGAKISKLLGDHRYADALEVILAWLTRGYSPELTLRKIEVWPEIDSEGNIVPKKPAETVIIEGFGGMQALFRSLADIGIDLGPIIGEPVRPLEEAVEDQGTIEEERGMNHAQHKKIFDPATAPSITLIGTGGVGSLVAVHLAKKGVREIEAYDQDDVASHNLPASVFELPDLGMLKIKALERRLKTGSDVDLVGHARRWTPGDGLRSTVVMCVDSMDERRLVWEACCKEPLANLLIDTRVGEEFVRVYAIDLADAEACEEYARAVSYGTTEAAPTTCGRHGVLHINGLAASIAVGMLTAYWMRGEIPKRCFEFTMHELREVQP